MSVTIEQITSVHSVLKTVYPTTIRPMLKLLIDDPESSVDDYVLKFLDILMDYNQK